MLAGPLFILLIIGCSPYKSTVARIGSVFCKFEWECSTAGIFKLDPVFAKKIVIHRANLVITWYDFSFSIRIHLCAVRKKDFRKCSVIGDFEKFFGNVRLIFVICSVRFCLLFQENIAQS